MKKFFIFILLIFITGCSQREYNTYYTDLFDTFSSFTCYADNKSQFDSVSDKLYNRMSELNKSFDIYNNYDNINNIKTINDNAGIKPVKVNSDIIEILEKGKEAHNITNGKINIAMGSVLEIWHNYREEALDNPKEAKIPDIADLEEANKHTNIDNIVIDKENSTVFIKDKYTKIDLGAISKGFCADKAKELLKENNVKDCLLNFGGNIICINDSSKEYWTVGVQDPENEKDYIDKINLVNSSAVTSGNYQRYYEVNGIRYHHIIDPLTLMPSNANKSVTIICDESTKADIFSTALFILPYSEGLKIAEENNIKALWVTSSGEVYKNY